MSKDKPFVAPQNRSNPASVERHPVPKKGAAIPAEKPELPVDQH
jgi:hypothetical protein